MLLWAPVTFAALTFAQSAGLTVRREGDRLRVSAPQPDFELRVSPSAINAPGGMPVPVTVTALGRDGFSGDIAIGIDASVLGG